MSTQVGETSNYNYLNALGFNFLLKRAPNVKYSVNKANLPGFGFNSVPYGSPTKNIPIVGDEIEFQPLIISFIIDEDLKNYLEIWNWMMRLGFPRDHQQFAHLRQSGMFQDGEGEYSDITLSILTNKKNVSKNIFFHNAFPVDMSDIQFDLTQDNVTYAEATVSFLYEKYEIEGNEV